MIGCNLFIRNYAALPTLNGNGEAFGGVYGFLTSLRFYVSRFKPDKVVVAWDGKGGSQKRRHLIDNYKKGRRPMKLNRNYDYGNNQHDQNRIYQRLRLSKYLEDLPIKQINVDNVEADDVIAYLCFHLPEDRKILVSTDRDYYQLLRT